MSARAVAWPLVMAAVLVLLAASRAGADAPRELRWGGDAEGGAPFVEADPDDPDVVAGFDVEIAELHRAWPRPHAAVRPGRVRVDRSVRRPRRLRHRPERHRGHARAARGARRHDSVLRVSRSADACATRGRASAFARSPICAAGASARSAARSPTTSCSRPQREHGIQAVSYDDDVHPYSDLRARPRRRGAARQRHRRAARAARRRASRVSRQRWRSATTSASSRRANTALRDRVDDDPARRHARRHARSDLPASGTSGTTISRRSSRACWRASPSSRSAAPSRDRLATSTSPCGGDARATCRRCCARRSSRSCCRACRWRSPSSLGVLHRQRPRLRQRACARARSRATSRSCAARRCCCSCSSSTTASPPSIRLPAFVAALLGLGLNYAAYESEIYRGALEAVPRGQLEAARTLGLHRAADAARSCAGRRRFGWRSRR